MSTSPTEEDIVGCGCLLLLVIALIFLGAVVFGAVALVGYGVTLLLGVEATVLSSVGLGTLVSVAGIFVLALLLTGVLALAKR